MAQVPFSSFYLGPTAVYTSPTGLQDSLTGAAQKGGNFAVGNYCDLTEKEAQQWNAQYGTTLHAGRYRVAQLSTAATTGNTGLGKPVALGLGTTVAQVALSVAGSGYTNGTFTCASSTSGGTAKAMAQVVVSGGVIISAVLINPGAGFTSVPTFGLAELTGGSAGSILAQMTVSSNIVCTFDSAAVSLADVRGVFLCTVTAAQIAAGAYVIIQELGIAPVYVSTATNTAAGCAVAATTAGAVTTTTAATAIPVGFFGYTLDLAAASTLVRVALRCAVLQG